MMHVARQGAGVPDTTAYFLDGAAVNAMKEVLGIGMICYPSLRNVLVAKIGKGRPLFENPVITVGSSHMNHLGRILLKAGFNPIEANSYNMKDDQALIDRIAAIRSKEVSRIVMVTSDHHFIPCLLEKARQGIRIFWVAVMSIPYPDGNFSVGGEVRSHFGKEFVGVPLETHAKEIQLAGERGVTSRCSRSQRLRRY
jgi:hypothetical protein